MTRKFATSKSDVSMYHRNMVFSAEISIFKSGAVELASRRVPFESKVKADSFLINDQEETTARG